jgi:hypothetical protein
MYAVLRLTLLAVTVFMLALPMFGQGNAKDVYQRDTGPEFGKKLPEIPSTFQRVN